MPHALLDAPGLDYLSPVLEFHYLVALVLGLLRVNQVYLHLGSLYVPVLCAELLGQNSLRLRCRLGLLQRDLP